MSPYISINRTLLIITLLIFAFSIFIDPLYHWIERTIKTQIILNSSNPMTRITILGSIKPVEPEFWLPIYEEALNNSSHSSEIKLLQSLIAEAKNESTRQPKMYPRANQ